MTAALAVVPDLSPFHPYAVHPLAEMLPLIEGAEFVEFVETIRTFGQEEPIMLSADGRTLLDGRNRFRACRQLGVEPLVATASSDWDDEKVISYIVARNISGRRHLTTSQRAMLGVEIEKAYAATRRPASHGGDRRSAGFNAGKNTGVGPTLRGLPEDESRTRAAHAVNVGVRSITEAKRLTLDAPDLAEQVKSGKKKLWTAAAELRAREDDAAPAPAPPVPDAPLLAPAADKPKAGRRIDSTRIVRVAIQELAAATSGLDLIDWDDVDASDLADWVAPARKSLTELRRLVNEVATRCGQDKETTQ